MAANVRNGRRNPGGHKFPPCRIEGPHLGVPHL